MLVSKLVQYLQKQISGEVLASQEVLEYFATDGSIFTLMPAAVVYPRDTTDVRKAARLAWQLGEEGKQLSVTARGKGTDQAGGALGNGIMLVFPAHMNKLLDLGKNSVTVQPGMVYGDLERTLQSHGRFLPPYPSSVDFSTLGGAVANNAAGEKTLKYGSTRNFVKSLQIVLANGQLITAEQISAQELNQKKGQTDVEGDIYRELEGLLIDNAALIESTRPKVSKNSAGYNVWDILGKRGSFNLANLLVGSQGTLGLVTEITFRTEPFNPNPDLLTAFFDDIEKAGTAVVQLQKFRPSAIEMVDRHLLEFLQKHNPAILEQVGIDELPEIVLLVEFDDQNRRSLSRKAKKAHKTLHELAYERRIIPNHLEQESDWKLRHSAAAVIWQNHGTKKALPIIEDGVVPVEKLPDFLQRVYALFKKNHLEIAVWGHAGNANFHMQPFLDLANTGDRQKLFKVMDEFYAMVIEMGGSTSAEHNDGRLRAPYLIDLYGQEMYDLFKAIKRIFDPYNILNPGVKIGVEKPDLLPMLRKEYSMQHLYDHFPHVA